MPSTREKKFNQSVIGRDLYGGEPLGEPPSPGSWRTPGLSEELVGEAVGRSRLSVAVSRLDGEQRAELLDGLLEQLGSEPGELPAAVSDQLLDALIKGKRGEREILGPDGVLGELTRRLIERALGEELSEHLGYPAGQAPPGGAGNSRNGGTPKTVLTDHGPVRIKQARDRGGSFEPQLVKKGQRRLAGLDEKIIALYAGGMSTREIETYIQDLYGPGVSRETVSRVTAGVLDDAKAWQTRPLEAVYPNTWIQTCLVHAVRAALRFVPYKDKRAVAADLKRIYTAVDRDHAEQQLERFAETWDPKYPMISAAWIENWERIVPFLAFPPDVRRAVYTTNTIEALNRQIRKIIKTRGSFPDEDSARKLLYLAITRAQQKWRHTYNWNTALTAFRIHLGDRIPNTA